MAKASRASLRLLPPADIKFVPPMLALAVSTVPEGQDWQYEIKLDGYRAIVVKTDHATVFSRRGHDFSRRFRTIASAFANLPNDTILDGEVVALDSDGRPNFNALQNARRGYPVYFYAFDLLAYRGKETTILQLHDRRLLLEQALAGTSDPIRLSPVFPFRAEDVVRAAREQDLEGVVAKKIDSRYEPGQRSGAWVKYRTIKGQELVIGGYQPGHNGFDSLLVGYCEGQNLIFIAKIRNGFTPALKREITAKMKPIEANRCPFANLPEREGARRGEALTAEVMKKCRWLKPQLVAQIGFTDWTRGNHLRHSRFISLREDKDAREVIRETQRS